MKKKNLLMTTIAIFGLATITMAQVPSYVPNTGLVGWWPFTGNAIDSSGNGNNGTVNGATLTSDRFGNPNCAYSFNGNTDFIGTPIVQSNLSEYSVSMWFKTTNGGWMFKGSRDCVGGVGSRLDIDPSTFKLLYGSDDMGYTDGSMTSNSYNDNLWHNVIGVWNGTGNALIDPNQFSVYVDGIFVSQVLATSVGNGGIGGHRPIPMSGTSNCAFGQKNCSAPGSDNFDGVMDDIGVWNRALTQQEITDLYNSCQLSVNIQPNNQTININNNVQFITASSDSMATYQWQTDLGVGFQNLNNVGQYSGTANDTLTIANTTLSNNNQLFRCIISSGSCTDTSAVAVLTVINNVGINEVSQSNLFSVYPNPAKSQINVKADAKLLGSIYTVYNNTGKLVLSGKIISENTTIELDNLSGGIYLFSVGENLKQTFKVIKE